MTHTPGPWASVSFDDGQRFIAGGDSKLLAQILTPPGKERDANSLLIASAPDLLAALRAIVRVTKDAMLPGPVYLSITEVNAAEAAIQRAEGGDV